MVASGSWVLINNAAANTAGAVFRPSGSIRIAPGSMPISWSCSVTIKRKSELVTITGALNIGPDKRCAELWNNVISPTRGANCFG